jgi:ABC-2 type transport system ATP-binding protein
MTGFAIETHGLTRTFGSLRAVDDVSLQAPRGAIFGFLGPNGAGKTTTIRLLLGLLAPTAGMATVLGFDTRGQGAEIRQRTGALLEHPGIYERLSARDNLEFYGRVWRIPPAQRAARIKELLTHLGLWERREEIAGKWSRGMKQKLAVARALFHRPELIFLDEPTAGLDPVAAAALRDDLAGLAASEGVTVFLTTHNLAEAEKLCSLIGVIGQGRLLAVDSPARLRSRMSQPRVEIVGGGFSDQAVGMLQARAEVLAVERQDGRLIIDLRGDTQVAALVSLLIGAGAQVEEVNKQKASLEEVFLTLVETKEEGREVIT